MYIDILLVSQWDAEGLLLLLKNVNSMKHAFIVQKKRTNMVVDSNIYDNQHHIVYKQAP